VAGQLSTLGAERVTLSGGEPTLRSGWDVIARALVGRGVDVNMVTSGAFEDGLADDVVRRALDAGMSSVGVSLDGPEAIHESVRGPHTYRRTVRFVERCARADLPVTVLTTVHRQNLPMLAEVRELAAEAGATAWRTQLAVPMGEMRRELVLTRPQYVELVTMLSRLRRQPGIAVKISDSIGYFGPLRRSGADTCFDGCQAGMQVVGIEADGNVKGCLSLQAERGSDDPFVEGNLQTETLHQIWHRRGAFAYNRDFDLENLSGQCARCRHAPVCRGGARCVAAATRGDLGEDPYCYYGITQRARYRSGFAKRLLERSASALLVTTAAGCGSADTRPETPAVVEERDDDDSSVEVIPLPEPPGFGFTLPDCEPPPRARLQRDRVARNAQVQPMYGVETPEPVDYHRLASHLLERYRETCEHDLLLPLSRAFERSHQLEAAVVSLRHYLRHARVSDPERIQHKARLHRLEQTLAAPR
jgi:radical SAM protein with 4Fe4S-binding SPASM domain